MVKKNRRKRRRKLHDTAECLLPGTFPSFKREIAAAGKWRGRRRGARGKSAFLPERRLYQSRVLAADILACLGDFNCSVIGRCRGLKSAGLHSVDRGTAARKLDKVDRCPPRRKRNSTVRVCIQRG